MPNALIERIKEEPLINQASNLTIGYSGGLDSTVLLWAVAQAFPEKMLTAVHVHHGLQEAADEFSAHCEQQVDGLNKRIAQSVPNARNIRYVFEKVTVTPEKNGLEAAARTARYQVFEQYLTQKTSVLLLGHHANDQVETFWLRALRGTGVKGLLGIPKSRVFAQGMILRPFLGVPRESLQAFATSQGLSWIEDPSNLDERFDRNWLRQSIMPALYQRKPELLKSFSRLQCQLNRAQSVLEEVLEADWHLLVDDQHQTLDISQLEVLSPARQSLILNAWLERVTVKTPEYQWLDQLFQNVIRARQDRQPLLRLGETDIRRYNGKLYAMPRLEQCIQTHKPSKHRLVDVLGQGPWQEGERYTLDWPLGTLSFEFVKGAGFSTRGIETLSLEKKPAGGRVRIPKQAHTTLLKHWLQQNHIVPWLREWAPCLVDDNLTVMDAAGVLAASFTEVTNNEIGWVWQWHLPRTLTLNPALHHM